MKSLTGCQNIKIFKKLPKVKISSHCLTDHSHKPRAETTVHGHNFTPLQQTHWWDVPFWV